MKVMKVQINAREMKNLMKIQESHMVNLVVNLGMMTKLRESTESQNGMIQSPS